VALATPKQWAILAYTRELESLPRSGVWSA